MPQSGFTASVAGNPGRRVGRYRFRRSAPAWGRYGCGCTALGGQVVARDEAADGEPLTGGAPVLRVGSAGTFPAGGSGGRGGGGCGGGSGAAFGELSLAEVSGEGGF